MELHGWRTWRFVISRSPVQSRRVAPDFSAIAFTCWDARAANEGEHGCRVALRRVIALSGLCRPSSPPQVRACAMHGRSQFAVHPYTSRPP